METKGHVAYVDGLRALAVLSVLGFHAAGAADAQYPNWVICGSRGVDLFFVISGFCLAFPFLGRRQAGTAFRMDYETYGGFLLRRFSRIAPLFYLTLSLFALLAVTPFGFPDAAHQATDPASAARDYFGNLAFLTTKSPLFNASFWTLGLEARWYLLCPLLIALYVRSRLAFFALGALMYGLYFFSPFGIADEGTLPCFMAGIFAADLALTAHPWRRFAWIPLLLSLTVAVTSQALNPGRDLGDPIWHAASFFLVVAGGTGVLARVLAWRPIAAVGAASYSIYLVHGPLVQSLVQAGVPRMLAACTALAAGVAVYVIAERPLSAKPVRAAIERWLASALPRLYRWRPAAPGGATVRLP
jgi:peptidoglycan/LPS O-acetylase OafA/YrhL